MKTTTSFLRIAILCSIMLGSLLTSSAGAQDDAPPGLRGNLFESPMYGWIMLLPESGWTLNSVEEQGDHETVHLTADDGTVEQYFVAYPDNGTGAAGCSRDLVEIVAAANPAATLAGWHGPEVEYDDAMPGAATAWVKLSHPDSSETLAHILCRVSLDGVLLGALQLRPASTLESGEFLPDLDPRFAGEGNTARAATDGQPPRPGVLSFSVTGWPLDQGLPDLPFGCTQQETFPRPTTPPPPGTGYFACDGQIANIDNIAATIDLNQIALGCLRPPTPEEEGAYCPESPVLPSQIDLLRAPAEADGATLTLLPGESADVVLWYSLPEGYPPLDVLYLEPDRTVQAGVTFFSAGTGSRPKARVGR